MLSICTVRTSASASFSNLCDTVHQKMYVKTSFDKRDTGILSQGV